MNPSLKEARDKAIETVEKNNSPGGIEEAVEDAVKLLKTLPNGEEVTSDTLVPDLAKYGFSDNRAVGVVMRRLTSNGFIKPTDKFRASKRPGNHLTPRKVYFNVQS